MVTLTPYQDYTPVPRVEIELDAADLPAGTSSVTIFKNVDGRAVEVRGAVQRTFVSSLRVLDLEAPFGVQTSYLAECWDGTTYLGRQALGTTFLDVQDTVVQQPLDPSLSARVVRLEATAAELHRLAPAELIYSEGRGRPTLVSRGPRRALTGLSLDLLVAQGTDASRLRASLGTTDVPQLPVWLIRTPPPQRIPRLLFVFVPDLGEEDLDYGTGAVRFFAEVDEVEPPAPGLVLPPLSYEDLDLAFASYLDRDLAYTKYGDMDSDWDLAGLAP